VRRELKGRGIEVSEGDEEVRKGPSRGTWTAVVLATTNIVVVIGLLAKEVAEVDSLMRLGSRALMGLIAFVVVML
jgi:hypothetical protein